MYFFPYAGGPYTELHPWTFQTYRFRCKFPKCTIEHYRKDQMENHQAKAHGKVDAEMMEDRSLELYNLCQKMSMELLGTTGNTPGPTAAKAQVVYDQILRKQQESAEAKRRRKGIYGGGGGGGGNIGGGPPSFVARPSLGSFGSGPPARSSFASHHMTSPNAESMGRKPAVFNPNHAVNKAIAALGLPNFAPTVPTTPAKHSPYINTTPDLECLLCHKFIMNRIKGFHILWHLNNDLGIVRYSCR